MLLHGSVAWTRHAERWLPGLPAEATIALDDVAGAVREGLLALSCSAGLLVMPQIMAEEMTAKVGPKGLHSRSGSRPARGP
jgi:hypothetical protein